MLEFQFYFLTPPMIDAILGSKQHILQFFVTCIHLIIQNNYTIQIVSGCLFFVATVFSLTLHSVRQTALYESCKTIGVYR